MKNMENVQLTEKGNPIVVFPNMDKERERFFLKYGSTPLNKILGYRSSSMFGFISIDLAPAKDLGLREKKELIEDGFRKLAILLEKDRSIKEVIAVSSIVAEHPKLLQDKGFEIADSLSDKVTALVLKVLHNKNRAEGQPKRSEPGLAVMQREDFLETYLHK